MYLQGKGSQRSQNKKVLKNLKKFLTKQKPCDIIKIQKERGEKQKCDVGKKRHVGGCKAQ